MRRRSIAVGFVALLCLGGCGQDQSAATAATPALTTDSSTTSTTTPPTTSTTSTTSSTTSTSSTTTSTSSTTTAVPGTLPNPEAVPADPRAAEPLVQLGTIEIPKIGVSKPFYEGITLTTLDHGPGHWPGTAMPGQLGNVVVAGHRVSHDKPFRHLEQLEPGDDVIFTTDSGQFVYNVTSTEVVYPSAVWIADQTPDYTATLFACHPAGSTKQRIVVHLAFAPNG
ncbi:MAG: class E sortase [Ilumatobacteraceae bacterium]